MPVNYPTDRTRAESVLNRLCAGAQIDGIRFGPVPQLLIADQLSNKPPVPGQVYLNLASAWQVFPARPETLPRGEEDVPDVDEAEALRQLCELREAVIVKAELAPDAPDLLLTFEDGRVFFLVGRNDRYESWQFGVAYAPNLGTLVVACPGGEVAVWELPDREIPTDAG